MKNQSHIQMWPAVLIAAVLALQPLAATAKESSKTSWLKPPHSGGYNAFGRGVASSKFASRGAWIETF